MTWEINVTHRFERDFRKLNENIQRRIIEAVDTIRRNPFVGKVLRGMPYRCFRIGNYRLIYHVNIRERKVFLMTVIHRRIGYKRLG
ncbi:MAG: type II toxin-antitoxin system RelE/ParE family toxin [archaeon GB-1867-035]|nr:type II toxin-antitoxin system RelE/ParE family toxin [Candidatus Culexmicrobium profundum]